MNSDGLAPQHRQDDHDVQADQQARRGRVVDRRDAALRRVGMQPDAEDEIEAAPVEQAEQDLVRDLARARPAGHRPGPPRCAPRPTAPAARGRRAAAAWKKARIGDSPAWRAKMPIRARCSRMRASHSAARPATTMPSRSAGAAQAELLRQAQRGSRRAPAGWRRSGRAVRSASRRNGPAAASLTPKLLHDLGPGRRRRNSATAGKASSACVYASSHASPETVGQNAAPRQWAGFW